MADDKPKTILDSMLSTREKRQRNIAIARTKITHRPGRTPRYPNEQVKQARSEWMKSGLTKNVTLMHLAVLHKMPVRTLQRMCYDPSYRKNPDAQPDAQSLAAALARVQAIQAQYDEHVKQEAKDKKSARNQGKYSANDYRKMERSKVSSRSKSHDKPDWLKATENKAILNRTDATEAARIYLKDTNNLHSSALSALVRDIAHGLQLI